MKTCLGFFLFLFSVSTYADVLLLRGHVPETYNVRLKLDKKNPSPEVISNLSHKREGPKITIDKSKNIYVVSVIHN